MTNISAQIAKLQRELYEIGNAYKTQRSITSEATTKVDHLLKNQLRLHAHLRDFLESLDRLQREMKCLGDSHCSTPEYEDGSNGGPTGHHPNCPRAHAASLRYIILRMGEAITSMEAPTYPGPGGSRTIPSSE